MRRLAIFGAGGFGREILAIARNGYSDLVFAADEPGAPVMGVPVVAAGDLRPDDHLFIAIGCGTTRRRIDRRFRHLHSATLIASTAVIGDDVKIGPGSIFCDFTLATVSSRAGRHFHCNAYSHVAHDCWIGDYVTFASQVGVNGNTIIEDGVTIGCGAKLRNGTPERPLLIGRGAVIGMGAVVTKDVPPGVTMIGNPARPLENSAPDYLGLTGR